MAEVTGQEALFEQNLKLGSSSSSDTETSESENSSSTETEAVADEELKACPECGTGSYSVENLRAHVTEAHPSRVFPTGTGTSCRGTQLLSWSQLALR